MLALALPLSIPWIDFSVLTLLLAAAAFWVAAIVTVGGQAMWWTCRLYAVPKDGTPLCIKELGAGTLYLATATFGGALFAGDVLPPAKVFGLTLFLPAFFLAQREAREYCRQHLFGVRPAIGVSPAIKINMSETNIPISASAK